MATSALAGYCTEGGITTKHNFWGGCGRHSWLWQVNRIRRITIPRPPIHWPVLAFTSFSQTVGRACEGVDVGETVAFQVEITLSTCTEQLRREARQRWALTMLMCWLICTFYPCWFAVNQGMIYGYFCPCRLLHRGWNYNQTQFLGWMWPSFLIVAGK